ncbi:protein kinase-like domain, concanavalin A-like lectin/glucanase domain protein [Tanacetum coccineum]
MGDENPICTLGDYSKPSHKGYTNSIELPVGNNVVPLRCDTIRLVQNGCSFHGLWSEDPNQHLKDFLKLVDSLDLDAGSINTWEHLSTRFLAQFFPSGRIAKLRIDILMFQQHHRQSLSEAGPTAQTNFTSTDYHTKEELQSKRIKSPSKLLSPKYLSQSSIIEQNKNPSSPKCVHFVNSIVILNKENEAWEEGSVEPSKTKYTNCENANETDEEVESKKEVEEETEGETEEEVEDGPKHLDTFPTMKELRYHKWLLKNPRPPWVKAKIITENMNNVKFSCMIGQFNKDQAYLDLESPINIMSRLHYNWIMSNRLEPRRKPSNPKKNCNFVGRVKRLRVFFGNFTYKCDFMVLEDTTSVIDHYLGSGVFEKPFKEETGLVYNKEEGTVVFERDKERIIFKMPHKMDMFKHVDFTDRGTDSIPSFVIESDDDNYKKTTTQTT